MSDKRLENPTTPLFLFSESQLLVRKQRLEKENAANEEIIKRIDVLLQQRKFRGNANK